MRSKRLFWAGFALCAAGFAVGSKRLMNELGSLSAPSGAGIPDRAAPEPSATAALPRRTNSLGQVFAPIPGVEPLFCVWDARVMDFEAFATATGHAAAEGVFSVGPEGWAQQGGSWKNPGFAQGPSHPVVGISWNDAKAFCQWLTQTERDRGLIASNEYYRLPTDWEWGMAVGLRQRKEGAPSEKNGKISSLYPWGTQWPPPKGAGNYAGTEVLRTPWPASWGLITNFNDGYPRTSPVGTFAANRFGLYDMGGNAWQWCEDFYNGVRGPRVLRGASWSDRENEAFTSCRRFDRPESRVCNYGFRVVLAKSPL